MHVKLEQKEIEHLEVLKYNREDTEMIDR